MTSKPRTQISCFSCGRVCLLSGDGTESVHQSWGTSSVFPPTQNEECVVGNGSLSCLLSWIREPGWWVNKGLCRMREFPKGLISLERRTEHRQTYGEVRDIAATLRILGPHCSGAWGQGVTQNYCLHSASNDPCCECFLHSKWCKHYLIQFLHQFVKEDFYMW